MKNKLFSAMMIVGMMFVGSVALAQTGTNNLDLTNSMTDAITVAGTVLVDWTAPGNGDVTSNATLAYSTHGKSADARNIKVALSAALPTGVSGTVSFAPAEGNGTTAGLANLSTSPASLVTAIPAYIAQAAANLTYAFSATQGFTEPTTIIVTFTLSAVD